MTIILLFAQANFDLALPDYLSRIVNYGIQQGGVENAVPIAIRQSVITSYSIHYTKLYECDPKVCHSVEEIIRKLRMTQPKRIL